MEFYPDFMEGFNQMQYDYEPYPTTEGYPHEQFVKKVQNCEAMCFSMMPKLTERPDVSTRTNQIKLLHDCARMCASQAIYTVTKSQFDKPHAKFCAMVCETCGKECMKYRDPMSQHCAKVCLDCAEACRRYAQM